ncbi:MAG: precorrin-3B C(17)-methyltransferase [Firmicutes bacterium]|nr:precorrin-3B C(17)-methyltransferase [Bacillota bacterium]MBR0417341.1 precorrin-3B C(17)-methyltransferase [Bacillota bacterium]
MSKLYVVGIGPGSYENMTVRAQEALKASDILIGYTVYIDLVKEHFPDKEMLTTGMRKEVERCELALEKAAEGKDVAMICSGDAGVYGMSGLIEELAVKYEGVEVETIPGVSAVLSGAAILGAPLMHDFAVISLSDLMTPWEKIEKRLECAAAADFVICLYNPSSHKRHDYLQKACNLVLKYQSPETVCGIAKNIGREGECTQVLTLKELRDTEVDMFSTVFIGNSQTRKIGDRMVTPRGYTHE